MLMAHRSLMRSAKPPFKQTGYTMTKGEQIRADIFGSSNDLVIVAQVSQPVVPIPSIGHYLCSRDDRFKESRMKALR